MLVAGATGGVGQLLTAKLLEVHIPGAACSTEIYNGGPESLCLQFAKLSARGLPSVWHASVQTPRHWRGSLTCQQEWLAGLVCVLQAWAGRS